MRISLTPKTRKQLIGAAVKARQHAYAPYSHYAVGAALLAADGQIFTGVNVENSVYPVTICAERTAVFSAVAQGIQVFQAIAVATKDGGTPCGLCRQVLSEFGMDILVLVVDEEGTIHQELTVRELLPHAFGPINLENGGA